MGSFANSLHVRTDRTEVVLAALHDLLRDADWRPTDERPDADEVLGLPDGKRAIQISAAADGWVSLLDSDLAGALDLGGALAEKLATTTIFFMVNDSDGWNYRLVDANGKISEFDTLEEDGDETESGVELEGLGEKLAGLQSLMSGGSLQQQMAEMLNQFEAGVPPEIQEIEARSKSGHATQAEMQRLQAWAMQEVPKFQSQLSDMLGGLVGLSAAPISAKKPKARPNRKQKAAQRKRLETLRPLLAPNVSDEQLQAALDKRTLFAEQALAEFLPLVSIPAHYAYLDYRSLSETTPEELAAVNIRFTHHLKFEST